MASRLYRTTRPLYLQVTPGRCHDALNRLLRVMPLSTRSLLGLLIAKVMRSQTPGYLCLDDV